MLAETTRFPYASTNHGGKTRGHQPHLPFLRPESITKPKPSIPSIDVLHPFPISEEGKDLGKFAQVLLRDTGLPLTRITQIAYMPNQYGNHDILGSYEIGGDHHGRLSFYKNMERIPARGQFAVAVHEGSHASSPFNTEASTNEDYGGETNRQRAALNVIRVANQAAATGIFLNGYHEYIYNLKDSGKLSKEQWQTVWLEETHAIASELAATNYRLLQNTEKRQFAKLQDQGNEASFVPLTSRKDAKGKIYVSGIDQTLMDLTKLHTVEKLHEHWNTMRDTYNNTATTPFHQIKREQPKFLPIIPGTEVIVIHVIYLRRSRLDDDPFELLLQRAGLRRRTTITPSRFI